MHHTAKGLKNFICMLAIHSSMIILMSCSIIIVYGTFWLKHNYYLTDPQDFSGSFLAETRLFFPCHDISCNLSKL